MTRFGNIVLILCFCFVIFSVGIITFKTPDQEISKVENRKLAQMPQFTKNSILSGEFFKQFETYFSDQIYNRDSYIKDYTREALLMRKTIINGVVLTKGDWLLFPPSEKLYKPEIQQSTTELKKLAESPTEKKVEYYFALAPYKMNILMDKYPSYLPRNTGVENQRYFLEKLPNSIHPISLYDQFKKNFSEEEIGSMYFKTDHHWNMDGAFAAYQMIINSIAKQSELFHDKPYDRKDYDLRCNNDAKFVGSMNGRLYSLVSVASEKKCQYVPNFDNHMISAVARSWDGSTYSSFDQFYGAGFNNKNVLYGDLFTWDYPEAKFEFKTDNDLHLLILKDSYGNPIQPFLAQHFSKTSVLDLRHYHDKSVKDYIKDNDIDIVVFLYNDSNLFGNMFVVNEISPSQ